MSGSTMLDLSRLLQWTKLGAYIIDVYVATFKSIYSQLQGRHDIPLLLSFLRGQFAYRSSVVSRYVSLEINNSFKRNIKIAQTP
ncbi:unnamed protein product [Somion occarium]|uniref:Uncharacterized protein n=1 Tax=Somion occarium TaxID=3059160 RepID=A0ABP1DRF0_9APHY